MNTGGEAGEQLVRMSLNGVEVAAKITGTGAKHLAVLLYTILKKCDLLEYLSQRDVINAVFCDGVG